MPTCRCKAVFLCVLFGTLATLSLIALGECVRLNTNPQPITMFDARHAASVTVDERLLHSSFTVDVWHGYFSSMSTAYMAYESRLYPTARRTRNPFSSAVERFFLQVENEQRTQPAHPTQFVPNTTPVTGRGRILYGWPFRACRFEWTHRHGRMNIQVHDGWPLHNTTPIQFPDVPIFPLHIHWWAMLGNVATWSVVGAALLLMLGQCIRLQRRLHGRCPQCSYIQAVPGRKLCSECGFGVT